MIGAEKQRSDISQADVVLRRRPHLDFAKVRPEYLQQNALPHATTSSARANTALRIE
jgi:hypothetical protein